MRKLDDAGAKRLAYWCTEELVPLIDTALVDGVEPERLATLLLGLSYEVLLKSGCADPAALLHAKVEDAKRLYGAEADGDGGT